MNMDCTYIEILIQWLSDEDNATTDVTFLRDATLKDGFQHMFPLFAALYCLVGVSGAVANIVLMVILCGGCRTRHVDQGSDVLHKTDYRDYIGSSRAFLMTAGILGMLLAVAVTPLTLVVILLPSWILGPVVCRVYPILHTLPLHGVNIALVAALTGRYMSARHPVAIPNNSRHCLTSIATAVVWFLSTTIVLPYMFHIEYTDVAEALGDKFQGIRLCSVSEEYSEFRNIHVTCLTLVFCFCPVIALLLYVSTRRKLLEQQIKPKESTMLSVPRSDGSYYPAPRPPISYQNPTYDNTTHQNTGQELAMSRSLLYMVLGWCLCWCPLVVLSTSHQFDHRLEGRQAWQRDFIHLILMLVAFLSSWVVPAVFLNWWRGKQKYIGIQQSTAI